MWKLGKSLWSYDYFSLKNCFLRTNKCTGSTRGTHLTRWPCWNISRYRQESVHRGSTDMMHAYINKWHWQCKGHNNTGIVIFSSYCTLRSKVRWSNLLAVISLSHEGCPEMPWDPQRPLTFLRQKPNHVTRPSRPDWSLTFRNHKDKRLQSIKTNQI